MSKVMKQALEECKKSGKPFVDKQFPPSDNSLGARKWGTAEWLRPAQIYEGQTPALYIGGISPNDIKQGALGDCYFLSALSVLAERPRRIEHIFRNHIDNPFGLYCVTLHVGGLVQDVLLDDTFPCDPKTHKPLFSRNTDAELWVLLLEKAYAKLHGSYAAIEAGSPATALFDLTGAACFIHKCSAMKLEEVWDLVLMHDKRDHVMCCAVPDVPDKDLLQEVGLVEGHAYALIEAKQFKNNKLFRVRNPWGRVEWKGAWSDGDSSRWTPEAKKALDFKNEDDGSFWMDVTDWKKYFENVTILTVENHWRFKNGPAVDLRKAISVFPLTVKETTDLYVTIHQPKTPLGIRMCVLSANFPCFPFGGTKETFVMSAIVSTDLMRLPPGHFHVVIEVYKDHVPKLPLNIVASVYSSHKGVEIDTRDGAAPDPLPYGTLFLLPGYAQKYGACSYCSAPLVGSFSTVKEQKFHSHCLVCWFCGVSLGTSVMFKDDHLACKECATGARKASEPHGQVFTDTMMEERRKWVEQLKSAK